MLSDALYSDKKLKQLMMKCLLKERTIIVSRYSPTMPREVTAKSTNSKIKIESTWKLQKDMLIDKDTLDMYETLTRIVKSTVNTLKYHLKLCLKHWMKF
jgi:hypothetical protein